MSAIVRALITFNPSGEPGDWDGLLLQEENYVVESLQMLRASRCLAEIRPDGTLMVADAEGRLRHTNNMAALGRALYVAMLGREPDEEH